MSAPLIAETNVPNVLGQLIADGAGNFTAPIVGVNTGSLIDEINPPATTAPTLAQNFSATIASLAPNGRATMTTTGTVPTGFPASTIFYVVSPGTIRMISADATDTHPNLFFLNH